MYHRDHGWSHSRTLLSGRRGVAGNCCSSFERNTSRLASSWDVDNTMILEQSRPMLGRRSLGQVDGKVRATSTRPASDSETSALCGKPSPNANGDVHHSSSDWYEGSLVPQPLGEAGGLSQLGTVMVEHHVAHHVVGNDCHAQPGLDRGPAGGLIEWQAVGAASRDGIRPL